MNLEVHVADYYEDSPCKVLADKSYLTSATDVDSIVKIINEEKIDGVLMGYADVLMSPYIEICNKTGLPCYANQRTIDITNDKAKFKSSCRKHNIPVVKEYSYDDVLTSQDNFPVIVKPVDNSGARGIYISHNIEEFKIHYHKSLEYSTSKHVIIEPLVTSNEATIFYYLHEGIAYLLGIGDRLMYKQDNNYLKLPVGYIFPSKDILEFIGEQDENIKRLFKTLNMNEGMVFIQTFNQNGHYVVYEMGYRLTGSIEHHLIDAQYGFNHLKAMIDYAIGNEVNITNLKNLDPTECCMANISLLLKRGRIAKYLLIDEIKNLPYVHEVHISHPIGFEVDNEIIGRLAQVGVRILLTANDKNELLSRMDYIKNKCSITDSAGEEIIIKDYSYKNLGK